MRAPILVVVAACNAGGSFSVLGGGTTSASAAPGGAAPSSSAQKPGAPSHGGAGPARVSSERPAVRPGGGYAMTDAQRDADPTGELIYPIVPLGSCADPGPIDDQSAAKTYPARPADPWHAIAASRVPAALPLPEKRMKRGGVHTRTDAAACDGAHDHCFRDCTWLVRDSRLEGIRSFEAFPAHLRPDGFWSRPASENRYVGGTETILDNFLADAEAYRTIPATDRLLVVGMWIAVHPSVPRSEREAFEPWRIGTLRAIDREHQTVALMGSTDTYPLAATRIPVFVSRKNGAIEMLGTWKREELVVTPSETFTPMKESE